jgi:hypothetical protein
VRSADDLAGLMDGGVPNPGVIARQSLLGRVQPASDVRVALDLHDDGPLTVEHVDRGDAALFAGPDEGFLHLGKQLGQPTWDYRSYGLPQRRQRQAWLWDQRIALTRRLSYHAMPHLDE